MVVYGWHGLPNGDGTWHWVHVPDETFENEYPRSQRTSHEYVGVVHENVDIIEVETILRINGEVMTSHTSSVQICKDCGVRSTNPREPPPYPSVVTASGVVTVSNSVV